MAGNATVFEFVDTNPTVRIYLNTAERAAVTTWQPITADWKIELHPGHATGEPFYIRLNGNKDTSNVPKVDTINFRAIQYANLELVKNFKKLEAGLSLSKRTNLTTFLMASFDPLKIIAHRWWNDEVAPADPVVVVAPVDKACIVTGCLGRVPIVASGKAACNICYSFQ